MMSFADDDEACARSADWENEGSTRFSWLSEAPDNLFLILILVAGVATSRAVLDHLRTVVMHLFCSFSCSWPPFVWPDLDHARSSTKGDRLCTQRSHHVSRFVAEASFESDISNRYGYWATVATGGPTFPYLKMFYTDPVGEFPLLKTRIGAHTKRRSKRLFSPGDTYKQLIAKCSVKTRKKSWKRSFKRQRQQNNHYG